MANPMSLLDLSLPGTRMPSGLPADSSVTCGDQGHLFDRHSPFGYNGHAKVAIHE
jgi:hypothetical protein